MSPENRNLDWPDNESREAPRRPVEMIVRIDERTLQMLNEMKTMRDIMVTRAEFSPVKAITYGLVGIIMSSVVIAIVSVVLSGR